MRKLPNTLSWKVFIGMHSVCSQDTSHELLSIAIAAQTDLPFAQMGLGQRRIELNGLGGILESVDILLLLYVGLSSPSVKVCIFGFYLDSLSSHRHPFSCQIGKGPVH
jgi:hypothetical protein